jgi:hypothetical protein
MNTRRRFMKTALIVIVGVVVLALVGWPMVTRLLVKHLILPAKSLTAEELRICERIVREGKGYPYVCRLALQYKRCPCLPCAKLEKAKSI